MTEKYIDGEITNVSVNKSGITNGKKWTKFDVVISGENFKTFDKTYLEQIGELGRWTYNEEPWTSPEGKTFNIKTLVEFKNQTRKPLGIPLGTNEEEKEEEKTLETGKLTLEKKVDRLISAISKVNEELQDLLIDVEE